MTEYAIGTVALESHACNCIGPQPGQSKCPCMLNVERRQQALWLANGLLIDGKRYRLVADE